MSSLEWFYSRMLTGGIIVSHDPASGAGPRTAFTEFFEHRPEPLIELSGDQAMIVKVCLQTETLPSL
jgi:O-methyltransferase